MVTDTKLRSNLLLHCFLKFNRPQAAKRKFLLAHLLQFTDKARGAVPIWWYTPRTNCDATYLINGNNTWTFSSYASPVSIDDTTIYERIFDRGDSSQRGALARWPQIHFRNIKSSRFPTEGKISVKIKKCTCLRSTCFLFNSSGIWNSPEADIIQSPNWISAMYADFAQAVLTLKPTLPCSYNVVLETLSLVRDSFLASENSNSEEPSQTLFEDNGTWIPAQNKIELVKAV